MAMRWACVVAALGAAAYLLLEPASADLAAQLYRAKLVGEHGLGVWDNGWFAGHHTPGYSLLFPPLGALVGVRLAGALAAVAATALFALLAQARWGARAGSAAAAWFAAGAVGTLLSGRLTFLLGAVLALAAALALQRGRRVLAAALAAVTTLASPVAGLFLALGAIAWALAGARSEGGRPGGRRAWGAAIAFAALAPAAALAVLFPEGGDEPFVASAFWPALAGTIAVALVLPARERALRTGAAIYALACVAAFVLDTPLGGNVTRLGALLAGPVLLGALLSSRGQPPRSVATARLALLGALAVGLAYWQAYPAVRDVVRASGDPSTAAAYHAPLVRFLESRRASASFRVEIPFTENHWEAVHVAPSIALARGWERQLDRRYGALFYDGSLDATSYRAWLDEHAVAYVALPDVPLDYSARAEARLIAGGLPYLRPVWRDAHWRVYAVRRRATLAEGAARDAALTPRRLPDRRPPARRRARARASHALVARDGRTRLRRARGGRDDARARARARRRARAGTLVRLLLSPVTARIPRTAPEVLGHAKARPVPFRPIDALK